VEGPRNSRSRAASASTAAAEVPYFIPAPARQARLPPVLAPDGRQETRQASTLRSAPKSRFRLGLPGLAWATNQGKSPRQPGPGGRGVRLRRLSSAARQIVADGRQKTAAAAAACCDASCSSASARASACSPVAWLGSCRQPGCLSVRSARGQ
jgi:hypothetical protein